MTQGCVAEAPAAITDESDTFRGRARIAQAMMALDDLETRASDINGSTECGGVHGKETRNRSRKRAEMQAQDGGNQGRWTHLCLRRQRMCENDARRAFEGQSHRNDPMRRLGWSLPP